MKQEIKLGDKVKCKYTGFTGIATARTEFINRCVQFSVTPKWEKKLAIADSLLTEMSIDETSLILIDKKLRVPTKDDEEERTGGPMNRGRSMRGY